MTLTIQNLHKITEYVNDMGDYMFQIASALERTDYHTIRPYNFVAYLDHKEGHRHTFRVVLLREQSPTGYVTMAVMEMNGTSVVDNIPVTIDCLKDPRVFIDKIINEIIKGKFI
jgi:hypothetical protein